MMIELERGNAKVEQYTVRPNVVLDQVVGHLDEVGMNKSERCSQLVFESLLCTVYRNLICVKRDQLRVLGLCYFENSTRVSAPSQSRIYIDATCPNIQVVQAFLEHHGDVVFIWSESVHICKNADVAVMKRRIVAVYVLRGLIAVTFIALLSTGCQEEMHSSEERGMVLFTQYCVRCHGAEGKGIDANPNISISPLMKGDPDSLIRTLAFGMTGKRDGNHMGRRSMPPVPYDAAGIAAIATYVRQEFGGMTDTVSVYQVEKSSGCQES